jgi:ABC transport system ATP-binding/permease protein
VRGELEPTSGTIQRADFLRIVYFSPLRAIDPELTLRRALAPDGDAVVYQGRQIHVASWASRFLFTGEQLNQPVERLSGGERARVLIARLMLEPADLLLLDEPTNDLDLPTLDILEESLLEFPGALVLVTHDRYLLDRVSTTVLGLDGKGGAAQFASYSQWEDWQAEAEAPRAKVVTQSEVATAPKQESKKKLSYLEAREFARIEQRVEDPAVATNAGALVEALTELEAAQQAVDALYARWAELTEKE